MDWGKRTLIFHQMYCIKIMERFDILMRSNTPASITTDIRPRDELEEEFERSQRQLSGG